MSQLPPGWTEAPLRELCAINPKHPSDSDRDISVSFVPMPAVSDATGRIEAPEHRPLKEIWKGYTHFQNGDVIFAKITPCMENGKIAVAQDLCNGLACGSTEFHVLRPQDGISAEYIWRFLRQTNFRADAERHMTGAVGQRRVPKAYLEEYILPLPPEKEQRRIVAKLDSLFARTKAARDELARIALLIEHYKEAILSAVFTKATEQAELNTTLGAVSLEIRNGLSRRPENHPPGVPILKISAIRPMVVRLDEHRYYVPEPAEAMSQYQLQPGDLLFTRYNGNPDLVASCGMLKKVTTATVYPDKIIRIRVDTKKVDPAFIEILMASPQTRNAMAPFIKSAAGQHGISGADLKKTPVPLPSIPAQVSYVAKTKNKLAWLASLESRTNIAGHLSNRLEQALLARAFRGELVPQDPNDEPAEKLLEHIRATRNGQQKPGHSRKSAGAAARDSNRT